MDTGLIARMSADLSLPEEQLALLARTAHHRYKVFSIRKKGGGDRTIAQPAKTVKQLQYWLMAHVLRDCPVHPCATAYKKACSIAKNAAVHKDNEYILKYDFKDFFPSIRPPDLLARLAQCNMLAGLLQEDQRLLCSMLFWKPVGTKELVLSIGAPSSPLVSNMVMFDFDAAMWGYCERNQICYTRYADDLTFSMNDRSLRQGLDEHLRRVLGELPFPRLALNEGKRFFGGKAGCRRVTGLVLANDGRVSLGRARKRLIRAMADRHERGTLGNDRVSELRGLLAFAHDVEPEFVDRLRKRYASAWPG